MSVYIEKILNSIQDLLVLFTPQMTIEELDNKLMFSDDQLFLYETVSVLITSSNIPVSSKSQLIKSLLVPLVNFFPLLLNQYVSAVDENVQMVLAKCLRNATLVASRVSKGFSNSFKFKDCECTDIFLEALRVFLPALSLNAHKALVHAGVRQYLHRMVVCLDNEILEILPLIIDYLKKNADPKDIQDFLPFINQIVAKFKQHATGFLLEVFAPVSNCIVKLTFETNFDNADSEVLQEVKDFKKAYYQFLMGIINQDQMNVLVQQGNLFKFNF